MLLGIKAVRRWAARLMASRPPDFAIGANGDRYMLRWWVIPRNKLFNIYLHRFLHDDEDSALHDHPWPSLTWVIKGGYIERFKQDQSAMRMFGDIAVRGATTAHRVELFRDGWTSPEGSFSKPIEAWTLFITGPVIRNWGFHCPKGWVPWQKFVDARDKGSVGRGCD